MIDKWLAHPLTRDIGINDPRTTEMRRRIIESKPFLRKIYEEWYGAIARRVPVGKGAVCEVGSGAGFLSRHIPGLITSDVLCYPGIDVVYDASDLPFKEGSLRALVLIDVLHHLQDPKSFFEEATRCVKPGGVIVMLEPWVTPWSRIVYRTLHHEPFRPAAQEWTAPAKGPLSGANGALPWIILARDRDQFKRRFPGWLIEPVTLLMPFRYAVSGGLSTRISMPEWTFAYWRSLEILLRPISPYLAMFALVSLKRIVPAETHGRFPAEDARDETGEYPVERNPRRRARSHG